MHETAGNHPRHVYETTPRTTRKHTLQGNRRNGKGEHTEPSHTHMILQEEPQREHERKHPTTRTTHHKGHPDARHSRPPPANATKTQPRKGRCHPKGYTPTGKDQAAGTGRE